MEPQGIVAVSDELDPVADALRRRGYRVVRLHEADRDGERDHLLAVVVSGRSDDVAGIQTTRTAAPVIDAAGMTAEEVVELVERRRLER